MSNIDILNASIREIFIGSNGSYGVTISANAEQRKIIKNTEDDMMAIFELKKL